VLDGVSRRVHTLLMNTATAEANLVKAYQSNDPRLIAEAQKAWDKAQAALRATFILDYGPGYPR
jgi:hypothetical protein